MDLRSFAPKATITVEIVHPITKEPMGIVVTVAGPSHPATVALDRTQAESRYESNTLGAHLPYEKAADEVMDELVARTLDWTNVELDGQVLPCTAENVRMVYENPDLATFRAQVSRAISDNARFFSI